MQVKLVIEYFLTKFKSVALSSSLAAEDQVLTDIILKQDKNATIFTLDTGRQFNETYEVFDKTQNKYKNIDLKRFILNNIIK